MGEHRKSVGAWEPSSEMRRVRRDVAEAFGLGELDLIGRGRARPVVRGRYAAIWVIKQRWPALSWPRIAVLFGGRDHSTIIHGYDQARERRARDAEFRSLTDQLAGPGLASLRARAVEQKRERLRQRRASAPLQKLVDEACRDQRILLDATGPHEEGCPRDIREKRLSESALRRADARFVAALRAAHPERVPA